MSKRKDRLAAQQAATKADIDKTPPTMAEVETKAIIEVLTKLDNPVVIDNDTSKAIKLADYTIIDSEGDGFTMGDICTEAVQVQEDVEGAKASTSSLGEHLVLMAAKCGTPEIFRAVAHIAEDTRKWGKAPKGAPTEVRNLYKASPPTYQQYKSKILGAMEAGVMPLETVPLTRKLSKPNKEGKTQVTDLVRLDTVNKLVTARIQSEPVSEDTTKAGVIVDSKGEQHLLEESKVIAGLINVSLGVAFDRISNLFENAPSKEQEKALKALKAMADRLEKVQPELVEQAQQVVNS